VSEFFCNERTDPPHELCINGTSSAPFCTEVHVVTEWSETNRRLSPDLSKDMVNLIGGELDVDDPRLQTNRTSQSLHHCSVGYHLCHMNDLAMKAYPCKRNQEHKQEQKMQANNLIMRWGLTNR
jgi:hypothetical protein